LHFPRLYCPSKPSKIETRTHTLKKEIVGRTLDIIKNERLC